MKDELCEVDGGDRTNPFDGGRRLLVLWVIVAQIRR